jgi:hypothetical protein
MVEANNPPDDEIFRPDVRVCVSMMNGKTDLLVLNPRYSTGYADLTEYLAKDEKDVVEIAKNLGMTIWKQCRDIDRKQFFSVIKELKKFIKKNTEEGKKTFVYFHYGGHGVQYKG